MSNSIISSCSTYRGEQPGASESNKNVPAQYDSTAHVSQVPPTTNIKSGETTTEELPLYTQIDERTAVAWELLPDEVAQRIFMELSTQDRVRYRQVCKTFRALINEIPLSVLLKPYYGQPPKQPSLLALNKDRYQSPGGLRSWLESISQDKNGKALRIINGQTMEEFLSYLDSNIDNTLFPQFLQTVISQRFLLCGSVGLQLKKFASIGNQHPPPGGKCFHPSGDMLVSVRYDCSAVDLWKINTQEQKLEHLHKLDDDKAKNVLCSNDGSMLLVASNSRVKIYFLDEKGQRTENPSCLIEHSDTVMDARFFSCGEQQMILTGSLDSTAKITAVHKTDEKYVLDDSREIRHEKPVHIARPSPDGQFIITVTNDYQVWFTSLSADKGSQGDLNKSLSPVSLDKCRAKIKLGLDFQNSASVDIRSDSKRILTFFDSNVWLVILDLQMQSFYKTVHIASNFYSLSGSTSGSTPISNALFILDGETILVNFTKFRSLIINTNTADSLKEPLTNTDDCEVAYCVCPNLISHDKSTVLIYDAVALEFQLYRKDDFNKPIIIMKIPNESGRGLFVSTILSPDQRFILTSSMSCCLDLWEFSAKQ